MISLQVKYRKELSNYLKGQHMYWRGRVALYTSLKSAGVGFGDEL